MSFWPFLNGLSANLRLQRFLDGLQDPSATTAEDLLLDADLLLELVLELQNIKTSYSGSYLGTFALSLDPEKPETALIALSNDTPVLSKDARGARLLEVLLQPHVLSGLLDYLFIGVSFFQERREDEEREIARLVAGDEGDEDAADDAKNAGTSEATAPEEEAPEAAHSDGSEVPGIAVSVLSTPDNHHIPEPSISTKDSSPEPESGQEPESTDDRLRRCIQAASDVLSADLWVILSRIIETPAIMDKLWLVLLLQGLDESLPAVAHLVRILDQLMDANSIQLLNYVRRQPNLVDTFVAKIEVPMLMDFFLRLIQTDKPDAPTGIVDVLSQQQLVPKIVDILRPHPSQFADHPAIPNNTLFFKQTAATDFIKALVAVSSNTALAVVLETNIGPNQLTRELVSAPIMTSFLHDIMLHKVTDSSGATHTNKHGINNCVGIVIELIRKNNSDYDLNCGPYSALLPNGADGSGEVSSHVMFQWLRDFDQNPPGARDPIYLGDMLQIFSDHLPELAALMEVEPIVPAGLETSDKPLGFTRFKVSELIAELLHCSNMILLNLRRVRQMVQIRDLVRLQQAERLQRALSDNLPFPDHVGDVTTTLDDVSLDDIQKTPALDPSEVEFREAFEALDNEDVSDDDEPTISAENPFVCSSRDANIRQKPSVGDYFKTRLVDLGILLQIIDKFTAYPWHNFFHNVVFDLIQQIFNGKLNLYNSFLIVDLFDKARLTDLIIRSYKEPPSSRPGYMGHLILISEEVVKFTSLYKPDLISPVIVGSVGAPEWEWFVNEVLIKTREVYNVVLGAEQDESDMQKSPDHDLYGFDSSTVGHLDLEHFDEVKAPIILGNSDNHDAFVNDRQGLEDEPLEAAKMPELKMLNVSPKCSTEVPDEEFENGQFADHDNNYLENLSGSSSSDDEADEDANELRRVPKHND